MADEKALLTQCVLDRLDEIEKKLDELVHYTQHHTGVHTSAKANLERVMGWTGDRLLVGWREISAYCRKSPSTLQKYARTMFFPACRWGRVTVSSPSMIDNWLFAVKKAKQEARGRQS